MKLIIGYGNTLRSDDGVGYIAARLIESRGLSSDAEVLCVHQLTPELAEPISRADIAVFIDACLGAAPGSVELITLDPVHIEASAISAFVHHQTPEALLGMASTLFGRVPRTAIVISIAAGSFAFGECLSQPVREALPGVVDMLLCVLGSKNQDAM